MNYKPKKRSNIRIKLGKIFYRYKRYIKWYFSNIQYSKTKQDNLLDNIIFNHKTPLYRKLKKVDLWLQQNKVQNLKIAIKSLDGIIINPGETLSYWKLIGKTSKRKGYKKAMVLFYGKIKAETGGGLCQLSNLIFWMALHSPLTIRERYRHSYDVFPDSNRKQPFGSGATCVYNYRDLQLKNETNSKFQIKLAINDDFLTGQLLSNHKSINHYEVYEKNHKITLESWGGYLRYNTIFRKVFNIKNELIADEYLLENNALMMYQPFLSEQKKSRI